MKKVIFYIFIPITLFAMTVYGQEYQAALKGGAGINSIIIDAFNNTEDHLFAFAPHTQVGYRLKHFEFNIASHIHFGQIRHLEFHTQNAKVSGNGKIRTVSFAPLIKIIVPYDIQTHWRLYFQIGPNWSQQNISIDNPNVISGNYTENNKLSFQSIGIMAGIGFEEQLPKNQNPVYIEIMYNYNKAYEIYLLDKPTTTKYDVISHENTTSSLYQHIIMLNMGITIF